MESKIKAYKVARAKKDSGLSWRAVVALSPLLFDKKRKSKTLTEIHAITGITLQTLKNMLAEGGDLHAFLKPKDGTLPAMLVLKDGSLGINPQYPLGEIFHRQFSGEKLLNYFWRGQARRECPLSPVEDYLYWWFRQRIQAKKRTKMDVAEVARLTRVPELSVRRGVAKLLQLGWLVPGQYDTLKLGTLNIKPHYKLEREDGGKTLVSRLGGPVSTTSTSEDDYQDQDEDHTTSEDEDQGGDQGGDKFLESLLGGSETEQKLSTPAPAPALDLVPTPVKFAFDPPPSPPAAPTPKRDLSERCLTHRRQLYRAHAHVLRRCGGDVTAAVADGRMARWVQTGAVAAVYVTLHSECDPVSLGCQPVHDLDDETRSYFFDLLSGRVAVDLPPVDSAPPAEKWFKPRPKTVPAPLPLQHDDTVKIKELPSEDELDELFAE